MAEANRCLFCFDAPCIAHCPTAIDIPQFIRKISTNNVEGAAETIFESNILGSSCARVCPVEVLCVGACVYNHLDQPPIQIGRLQQYATDRAMSRGLRFFRAGANTGKHVALIGAGPASLAAAHQLRVMGHACTIYEKRQSIGGLNVTGVAPYKMRADQGLAEAEWILGIGGITVKTGTAMCSTQDLLHLEQHHDAVFIGVGLGDDSALGIPGEDLPGVYGAVRWIEQMKLSALDLSQVHSCVVIGGGNTALDAARECAGLGLSRVTLVYRGRRDHASGYQHEFSGALEAGVQMEWQALPTAFQGGERVQGVQCVRVDAERRAVDGSQFFLPANLVLVAIGQSKLGSMFANLEGIRIEHGRIVTDDHGSTGRAKWFAGGDCRNGGKEVVNAAAEGKAAAMAIDAFLKHSQGATHA